ncbi:hypothetical protein LEP1GSC203_0661 [Leptospira terpstrae serovar Hualin str. LT 11-33 = ATCC 700639]|uniref:Uncharacterized protein n=1 Tax=Leptospira terpstrae serovar Hualin str. LT 11-33 = ATCC 700639 TaxID=1257025 RepID=N1VUS4_9LEPT|nr:hypothetical protein LEP1GSC203_0661 [Leptospira terpstrae serovar Hualin str. LT 11-33 = ATCC 700639]
MNIKNISQLISKIRNDDPVNTKQIIPKNKNTKLLEWNWF